MKLTFRIAWRYIFSKKSTNAINIISGISMSGIVIGSAALIIVLSAFNGFEDLVLKLYNSFYPDVTISPAEGKVFIPDTAKMQQLKNINGVQYVSETLEESALLTYKNQEHIATIKGVDSMYAYVNAVDDSVFYGNYILDYKHLNYDINCAVFGSGIAGILSINLGLDYPAVQVFMPRRGFHSTLNPKNAFIQQGIQPMGIFRIQQDFDNKYVITSLNFIHNMLEYDTNEVSQLEIKLTKDAHTEDVIKKMQAVMGNEFEVKSRLMQNEFLYKVMKNEKWVVYLILTFILIIAAFNMIGSISMLVIDKKKDISILRSLGSNESSIRNIFFIQGILQTLVSIALGFIIATALCFIQLKFGLITIPGSGSFVVTAYPISIHWKDYVWVFLTIIIIGCIASFLPALMASRQRWLFKQEN